MAIVTVLFVQVGEEEYGIPIKNVDEITGADEVKRINGRDVIKHNDEIYPVVDLAERFDVPGRTAATDGGSAADSGVATAEDGGASTDDGATAAHDPGGSALATDDRGGVLVRIRESERQIAIRCDSVNAQEEVVVKPLEGILSGTAGLSGTAVLGDGNIVHILDVVTL
jgi:two-component system chemotaxis sensor kinase CheA